jgi:hypothetical protein
MGHRLNTYRESVRSQHSKISPLRAYLFLYEKISSSKRHLTLIAVTAVLLVSSILTAFSPLTEQASALSNSEMNLSDKALSYSTLNALRLCVKDEGSQQADNEGLVATFLYINDAHAKSGNWWRNEGNPYWGTDDGASRAGSYLNPSTRSTNKGGDGQALCSDILKTGVNLWGYSSALDLLCDAGIKRADGSACKEGTDRFGDITKYSDQIYNAVVKKVYGGKTPSLYSDSIKDYPGRYLLYSSAFTTGCVATASASNAENKFVYTDVKVVAANGTITPTRFVGAVPKSDSRPVYIDRDNLKEIKSSCSDIATQMNKYAAAYSAYRKVNVDEPTAGSIDQGCQQDPNKQGCDEDLTSCVIEGVGWIVCPILTFMGGIVDGAYNFVAGLLVVQPLVTTAARSDDSSNVGIYTAWSVMRNIANIAFVIAFLIIIFSQLSGMGVSNYGVKKLLPRLVVAAILVNLSFWVCAIAVDLSNVFGASMIQVFGSVQQDVIRAVRLEDVSQTEFANNGQWTNIVGGVIAGAAIGGAAVGAISNFVGLAALIPALLAAIFAILTVFLVLTLRQALIILLVVVSPLAFVAYLLPNTEDLFTKWRKLFTTLLLMYPIIAALFGASALASNIIMNSADGNTVVQIMGACIAILPLAVTPLVMKSAGGLLNRFGGIVNNTERGPIDRLKKAGAAYGETRNNARNSRALRGDFQGGRGAFVRWRARRGAVSAGVKAETGRNQQQYIADAMTKGDTDTPTKFAKNVAGASSVFGINTTPADPAALQRALAGAKFTIEKAEFDDIKAEQSLVSNLDISSLQKILKEPTTSPARAAATIDRMIKIGDPLEYADAVNSYGNDKAPGNSTVRQSIANSLRESGPQFLKASDLDSIATGNLTSTNKDTGVTVTKTLSSMARDNVKQGVYSEEKLVSEAAVNIRYAFSESDNDGKQRMVDTAAKLKENPSLRGKIKHNADSIDKLARAEAP